MSKIYEKSKFIEYLRETPLVSFACKKVGIARATYYRWFKDDRAFREQIQEVLHHGRENINDLAEATLIKMIKNENFNATRFWLQHNKKQYVPVRTHYLPPPAHTHLELKPGETCSYCGTNKPKPIIVRNGGGFYERQIAEDIKKFEAEAKKKRRLNSKERKAVITKVINRREAIKRYEESAEKCPLLYPDAKEEIDAMRSGKMEPPTPEVRPAEYIKKEDRVENIKLDIDFD